MKQQEKEKEYETICKRENTGQEARTCDGKSIRDRRDHLYDWTDDLKCVRKGGNVKDISASWCSLILILASVVLTGFGIYPKIANWGGAGALVPITGFANSVAAPAIEYKKEGQVFGIGCKIFTIAGPVILYGIVTSSVLGLLYWIGKITGVV